MSIFLISLLGVCFLRVIWRLLIGEFYQMKEPEATKAKQNHDQVLKKIGKKLARKRKEFGYRNSVRSLMTRISTGPNMANMKRAVRICDSAAFSKSSTRWTSPLKSSSGKDWILRVKIKNTLADKNVESSWQ